MPKKKYTQAEWARIQSRLPEEDREPYSSSPEIPTLEEIEADLKKPSTSNVGDPYYIRDPKTGLSPAQVDAQKALQEALDARLAAGSSRQNCY